MSNTSYETLRRFADIFKSKTAFIFDTLEDMRESVYVHNNMSVMTLGYYSKGDGGGALYYVEDKNDSDVDNGCDAIIVGYKKDLVARFVPQGNVLNVLQFGIIQGSTNFDTRFNEERIKYCEDYCISKGIGILYSGKAPFKASHRHGLINCAGIVVSVTTERLTVSCSIPLPGGLIALPTGRRVKIKGTYGIYKNDTVKRTGDITDSIYTAKCNGFCIDTEFNLTGNFTVSDSAWSNNLPVLVRLDIKDIELLDEILVD